VLIADAAGNYEFGVELLETAHRDAGALPEPKAGEIGPLALTCIAGARAWKRAHTFFCEDFWADANRLAWGRIAEVVAHTEADRDRAAAYGVFRAAWDYLRTCSKAGDTRIELLRQLLTHYRTKDLSGDLLADMASTLEAEDGFDAEARMLRALSAFKAAENRPEALARLDPDLAAALRALDPTLDTIAVKSGLNKPARRKKARKAKPRR
jgi:hypothetical protein